MKPTAAPEDVAAGVFVRVFVDDEVEAEEDIAVERRVGRSRISVRRSMFRERSRACFLLAKSSESELRGLYVSEKCTAAVSSLGIASRREEVEVASCGSVPDKVDKWVEDSMTDLWERFESAWRERRSECEDWERDWGSLVLREESGNVVSRLRYVAVTGSFEEGGGLGEGESK